MLRPTVDMRMIPINYQSALIVILNLHMTEVNNAVTVIAIEDDDLD